MRAAKLTHPEQESGRKCVRKKYILYIYYQKVILCENLNQTETYWNVKVHKPCKRKFYTKLMMNEESNSWETKSSK